MHNDELISSVMGIVGLLFVAAVSAFVMKRIRFPYTIGLVLVGVAVAFVSDGFEPLEEVLETLKFGPAMILFLFIPILIFESSFSTDGRMLIKNAAPAMVLAAPGLLLSTALTGFLVHWFTDLPLGSALVFGCLISATDPVAVIALFKELGVSKRLTVLVEGESVFNDATAIVVFKIIVGVVAAGVLDWAMVIGGIGSFFVVFVGGLLVGVVFGLVLIKSIPLIGDDPVVHIALTTVIAYGAFIVADHFLQTSGIMAVLGAGLILSYYGPVRYTPETQKDLKVFWENAAFVANSLIFLMLGLSEQIFLANAPQNVRGLLLPALIVIVIVLVVRAVVVFGLIPLVNAGGVASFVNRRFQTIMWWGGLRGAIAVALAMSLPKHFPFRWQIIDFTFAVILFTLLVNGTTMSWVVRKLGLDKPTPLDQFLRSFAAVAGKRAGLARLESHKIAEADGEAIEAMRAKYTEELETAEKELAEFRASLRDDPVARKHLLWLRALAIQREIFFERYEDNLLSLQAYRALEWGLRNQEQEIRRENPVNMRDVFPRADRPHTFTGDILHRFLPGIRRFLFSKKRLTVVAYEAASAVRESTRDVLAKWDELREISEADPADLAETRAYFEETTRAAEIRMRELETASGRAGEALRERMLRKICADGERDAIRELSARGGLPEMIADDLEKELDISKS